MREKGNEVSKKLRKISRPKFSKITILRRVRRLMEGGFLYSQAFRAAGVRSEYTLHSWRKRNPRIDKYLKACMDRCDIHRRTKIEDAHYKRLVEGKAQGIEYFFYLSNRNPERWQDMRKVAEVPQIAARQVYQIALQVVTQHGQRTDGALEVGEEREKVGIGTPTPPEIDLR